jgi:hypothetical protein
MTERSSDLSLDERKLALEERKLESENDFRRKELELKALENRWLNRLASPLTTTIIAGVLTLAATVGGTGQWTGVLVVQPPQGTEGAK